MKTPPPQDIRSISSISSISVLAAGPAEDRAVLTEILVQSQWPLCPNTRWRLKTATSLASALFALRKQRVPIVLCDCELGAGAWVEMLEQLSTLAAPPFLIVTSRTADEYLWAEALNLGAYDVLAKPFHAEEVVRVLSLAWLQWERQRGSPGYRAKPAGADN